MKKRKKSSKRIFQKKSLCAIVFAIFVFSVVLVYSSLHSLPSQTSQTQLKAALVDHLSLTAPNQTFIQKATGTLEQAGYIVDYYPGEEVTVEFYRNLPTHDYRLIILRVHSGFIMGGGTTIFLFSSEPYSTRKYVYEQLTDQIAMTRLSGGGSTYFGINENFVKLSMKGTFNNATIIMMGCNGLTHTTMAEAFTQKGAQAYLSWNEPVSASRTDTSTTQLLQSLLIKRQTIRQAVENTMKEVGPDPAHNSTLTYYPPKAADQTIEDTTRKP